MGKYSGLLGWVKYNHIGPCKRQTLNHSQRQKNRMRDGSGMWDQEPRGVNVSRTWESGLQMDAALQTPWVQPLAVHFICMTSKTIRVCLCCYHPRRLWPPIKVTLRKPSQTCTRTSTGFLRTHVCWKAAWRSRKSPGPAMGNVSLYCSLCISGQTFHDLIVASLEENKT